MPTSYLTTIKLNVNSTISNIKSRYICMDVENFYLNNMMDRSEYTMIQISMIPQYFLEKYNLKYKANNGYIFSQVTKGVYGLPQALRISQDSLVRHLETYGYRPSSKTPVLWTHDSRPINFTLVVNDFGIKYSRKEHYPHLKASLEDTYRVTIDWEGKLYMA